MTEKEERIAKALSFLNDKEKQAYKFFLASINRKEAVEIPEEPREALYLLYQTGKSCEEIRRLNHPRFSLGQIVCARVTDKWDERLDEYRANLAPAVVEQVQQVQFESASFIADMIIAVHRLHGEAIRKFIQTGDKNLLKGTPLENMNFKQYAELIKTLLAVTGQGENKTVTVKGTVTHENTSRSTSPLDLLNELVPDNK